MSFSDHVNKSAFGLPRKLRACNEVSRNRVTSNVLRETSESVQNQNTHHLLHKPSKLDLIDDTILTSLPLPPPAKARKPTEDAFNDSAIINTTCDMSFDDSFDVGDDPIVLVEDYVQRTLRLPRSKIREYEHQVSRKQSLDVFKRRLYRPDTLSLLSNASTVMTGPLNGKRKISEELTSTSETYASRPKEEIEEIFGKIPGSDSLKHCDICDRALYEISTVISSNKRPKIEDAATSRSFYKEFVCWECVETYEDFFNELCWSESTSGDFGDPETTRNREHSNQKLLQLFRNVLQKYHIEEDHSKFSNILLGDLHNHLGHPGSPIDLAFVERMRRKLRWRWRLNGLIPKPFGAS